MRPNRSPVVVSVLTLLWLLFAASSASAVVAPLDQPSEPFLGHYDVRVMGGAEGPRLAVGAAAADLRQAEAAARALDVSMRQAAAQLEAALPGVRVERSPIGGGIESVGGAPLTAPAPDRDGRSIVLGFLRAHAGVNGLSAGQVEHLEFLGESRGFGTRTVNLRQTVRGLPVFQSDTRAILDADGRLLRLVGRLVPGIDEARVSEDFALGPNEALSAALKTVGLRLGTAEVTRRARSERVYFPLGPGLVVPAWAQVTFTRGPADWYTVVDGRTGALLWRKDIRYHWRRKPRKDQAIACFQVYAQDDDGDGVFVPLASPAPGSPDAAQGCSQAARVNRTTVIGSDTWLLPQADENIRTTVGPNVEAYLDLNAADHVDFRPLVFKNEDTSAPCPFLFGGPAFSLAPPPEPVAGSCPNAEDGDLPTLIPFRRGALAHLFYLVNWFHDQMKGLGFTDTAGPFEATGDPDTSDPIHAEAQYGANVGIYNLASFTAPPDGTPGILRLSLWNGPEPDPDTGPNAPNPDRDASLDAEVVFHELMHGVTSRIIGNGAGLNWFPGRALAEGWSDFFALALLDPKGTAEEGAIGRYTAYKLGGHAGFTENYKFGMRRYPYTVANKPTTSEECDETNPGHLGTDQCNPLTWADVDDTSDCFGDNSPCTGQSELRWESFGANEIHNAGELWALTLWGARTAALKGITDPDERQATAKEFLTVVFEGLKLVTADPSFIQARDALLAACDTSCPFKAVIWTAFADRGLGTQACDSGGIATHYGIHEDTSDSEPVASCDTIQPQVTPLNAPITVTCTYVGPTWQGTITRQDGTLITDPSVASVTCDSLPAGTVIPDGDLLGRSFTMAISTGSTAPKINDIDLRIDQLTHPWVGDLTIMLKGPNGYGSDLIYRPANNPATDNAADQDPATLCDRVLPFRVPGLNRGDKFASTIISDDASTDLLIAGCDKHPFSGTWKPALQSSAWFTQLGSGQGPLSHFREITSLNGTTWTLFVSDVVPGGDDNDSTPGSLTSWSLIITPIPPL